MSECPRHWTGAFLSRKTYADDFSIFDVRDEQTTSTAVVGGATDADACCVLRGVSHCINPHLSRLKLGTSKRTFAEIGKFA